MYRQKLADFCYNVGLLRQEITFGRQAIRSSGFRSLSAVDDDLIFGLAQERLKMINVGCTSGLNNMTEKFLDYGFTNRRSVQLAGIVSSWYMGENPSKILTRPTFYRVRSDIRSVLGLDISSAPDVSVLTTQVREVELSPAVPPTWYELPTVAA